MNAAFGHDVSFALQAIWKVLVASVALGAGLPAIFALAIRALAWGAPAEQTAGGPASGGQAVVSGSGGARVAGRILAGLLLLVVAYGVVAGLLFIIASGQGKDISFAHVIPQIVAKKS